MSELDEWDQNDEYNTNPVDGIWRKKSEIESQNLKTTSEEWQVPMRRVKSTCIKTRASNRQFVCNSKFEAIAEQSHDKRTKQDRTMVRFDCDSGASMSCGACEEERERRKTGRE